MKCPYEEIECPESSMSGNCEDCAYYGRGVRLTGALPNISCIVDFFKRIFSWIYQ